MFSVARLFSFTRLLEDELRRERVLRRRDQVKAERERQALTDALARASNKQAVFDRPEPKPQPPGMAFGPTAIAAKRAMQEEEEQQKIFERAQQARNGKSPAIPEIPTQ